MCMYRYLVPVTDKKIMKINRFPQNSINAYQLFKGENIILLIDILIDIKLIILSEIRLYQCR